MTDNTELKRLAEAAPEGPWYQHGGIKQVLNHDCETVCETFEEDGDCPTARFIAAASPAAVLDLIAENDSALKHWQNESNNVQVLVAEVARLKAENAGLKTGYEAYEQVNAELKAENVRIERNRDMWKGQVERQAEELTALRKRIDDMSPFKGAPFTGPDTKCLACGGYHYGMSGLPCPNMRITAQADLPETRSGQIGAALGQGERS